MNFIEIIEQRAKRRKINKHNKEFDISYFDLKTFETFLLIISKKKNKELSISKDIKIYIFNMLLKQSKPCIMNMFLETKRLFNGIKLNISLTIKQTPINYYLSDKNMSTNIEQPLLPTFHRNKNTHIINLNVSPNLSLFDIKHLIAMQFKCAPTKIGFISPKSNLKKIKIHKYLQNTANQVSIEMYFDMESSIRNIISRLKIYHY